VRDRSEYRKTLHFARFFYISHRFVIRPTRHPNLNTPPLFMTNDKQASILVNEETVVIRPLIFDKLAVAPTGLARCEGERPVCPRIGQSGRRTLKRGGAHTIRSYWSGRVCVAHGVQFFRGVECSPIKDT